MSGKPVFWSSSDGKRIINIVAVCHAYRQSDGGWTVWTAACAGLHPSISLEIEPEDAASFEAALMPYGVGAP